VRSASRAACLAWSVVALAGCAAISGLDQISESACAPTCDASVSGEGGGGGSDGTGDTGAAVDSWQPPLDATTDTTEDGPQRRDAAHDAHSRDDGSPGDDSTGDDSDAPSGADASDAATDASDARADSGDAAHDAPSDAPREAETEAGCGPTNTVSNCGACGVSCAPASMSVATPSCNGGACSYTCQGGYLDCNAAVAPNTDGCECATPGAISAMCCQNSCPVRHSTGFAKGVAPPGLDQTFYDCNTTINAQVAMEACTQYSGNAVYCATNTAFGVSCGPGDTDLVVCNFYSATQNCVCWDYQGTALGWAVNSGVTNSCLCPAGDSSLGEVQFH
jgi:hypothetical protein